MNLLIKNFKYFWKYKNYLKVCIKNYNIYIKKLTRVNK